MNNNDLVIEFPNKEARDSFRRVYSGTFWSHHPNYCGTFVDDMILGSWTPLLHMERDKIMNFLRLRQDLSFFEGRIRID